MNKQEVEEGIKDIVFEGEMCWEGEGGQNKKKLQIQNFFQLKKRPLNSSTSRTYCLKKLI